MVVAVHADLGLGKRGIFQHCPGACQQITFRLRQDEAEEGFTEPVIKQAQLAVQKRSIIGWQFIALAVGLQQHQRLHGSGIQRIDIAALLQRGKIERIAKILQQHETTLIIHFQHTRGVHPGLTEEMGDTHKAVTVLMLRRGIHQQELGVVQNGQQLLVHHAHHAVHGPVQTHAEIAPETGISGNGFNVTGNACLIAHFLQTLPGPCRQCRLPLVHGDSLRPV